MRNYNGYIALSLLAAALAGCSSSDTGSTSRSPSGSEPLTGALAKYNQAIVPLTNACTWTSVATTSPVASAGMMTVSLEQGDVAQISVRAVDKAILVNGQTCSDTATNSKGNATSTLVKKIVIEPATAIDLDSTAETVIIDVRNGQFALAATGTAATTTGISVDLGGTDSSDVLAIAGSAAADKFGCIISESQDALGIKSATSKDVTFVQVSTGLKYIVDLSDGNDTFTQGDCTGMMAVYGGNGNDTINVGSATSTGDLFSGGEDTSGTDKDVLTYAARTDGDPIVINSSAATSTLPFEMVALTAGVEGEVDTLVDDFETITAGSGDDVILSGSQDSTYTLNGGAGNDRFVTVKAHAAIMNGGAGIDAADYSSRTGAVTATLGTGANDGETGDADNIALDVENYIASDNGDTVTGSAANNVFFGGLGNDTFTGGAGDDTFMAAVTSGTSTTADGDDVFNGGTGSDTIDYSLREPDSGYGVVINLDGTATSGYCVYSAGSSTWTGDTDVEADTIGTDVENAYGTIADDHIVGSSQPNVLLGFGGFDKLEGMAGNDQLDANFYDDGSGNTCNPVTLAIVGGSGTCAIADIVVNADTDAILDCGGDPLDIGSSTGATFIGCAIQQ